MNSSSASSRTDMPDYTTRSTCRLCGSSDLVNLFSLGTQFVSDFVEPDKVHAGIQCPIELVLCASCSLVQQRHTARQDFLYTRHYWYRSGVTATMVAALDDIAQAAMRLVDLKPADVVLDIGSNDGTLLRRFPVGIKVGFEPAMNLAEEGAKGLDVFINDFWSVVAYYDVMNQKFPGRWRAAYGARGGNDGHQAKIVTAIGMFYDLEDPNAFIADIAKVLAPDGVFVAQLMCLKNMIALGDVGNLTHEHLEFYSYQSIRTLFEQHGLTIFDIETNNVNGESYRIYAKKAKTWRHNSVNTVAVEQAEKDMGLDRPEFYYDWWVEQEMMKAKLLAFIKWQREQGKSIWIYGSSTKGNVLLQWWGLDHTVIEAAADRSPDKWGKMTIGTGIPIVSEAEFREANPDYALCLPYAFRNEFLLRESKWRVGGGKFIFPLPEFEVV